MEFSLLHCRSVSGLLFFKWRFVDFTVEVDSAKLASLMALGFEEAAARAMLIQCGNDVEAAAANLLARQSTTS